MKNQIKCPHCKSEEIVKRGYFQTAINDKVQRFYCKSCNKKFIPKTAFYRMRNNSDKITCAMDLFFRGISTRKAQEHLGVFFPHNADHSSIYRWIIKYSKSISKFTDSLKVSTGAEVQVDEIEFKRRKSHKAKLGNEQNWFIDSICPETRYLVASNYYQSRGMQEIKQVLTAIKEKTSEVKVVTTDGFLTYPKAIQRTFCYNLKRNEYNVLHNQVNARKGEGFNHPIERLHNTIRARTKTMRGFHGSISSANAIMKGISIYYNFITKHQGINKCPYELATNLKLNSNNKWLELIELSNTK